MTKTSKKLRYLVQKLGHIQVIILITMVAVIFAEVFAYIVTSTFNFPYLIHSTPIVTFLVTAILTPFISWHLLELLFSIDEMEQKMNHLATYDSMTKLLSRQAFFKRSLDLHTSFKQAHKSYTVAIIDIDNFKSINDTYGHANGDKVLIHFGTLISNILDSNYIIGRIGGEEFAVLSHINMQTMEKEMEKLHHTLVKSKIPYQDKYIKYTLSIGVFENKTPEVISFDEALSQADSALYQAKITGKNQSILFSKKISNLRTRK